MTTSPASDHALRYPIGEWKYTGPYSAEQRNQFIAELAAAPAQLRAAVAGLTDAQLDTPHRPGGWTVRQLAHHLPDANLNGYVRFKLTLTEDVPVVKPYDQERWAVLPDMRLPVEPSLALLEALHQRWVSLLRSMSAADFQRKMNHPEIGIADLDFYLAEYAWHARHHTAQIVGLRQRMGWKG